MFAYLLFSMEDCAVSGNVSDRSVAFFEGEDWSVWGVFRCMCDVAVDRFSSFTILLCRNN